MLGTPLTVASTSTSDAASCSGRSQDKTTTQAAATNSTGKYNGLSLNIVIYFLIIKLSEKREGNASRHAPPGLVYLMSYQVIYDLTLVTSLTGFLLVATPWIHGRRVKGLQLHVCSR